MIAKLSQPEATASAPPVGVLDLLRVLQTYAGAPNGLGNCFLRRLGEFLGAQSMVLVQYLDGTGGQAHRIADVQPETSWPLGCSPAFEKAVTVGRGLQVTSRFPAGGQAGPFPANLDGLGVQSAIITPLRLGNERVGCLFALDLPDSHRGHDPVQALEFLAPVLALVLRHATFVEALEWEIQARTRSLKIAEEELHLATQLRNQLAQAQKMDSLGSLAGGVAHDMNNVLGAILALASVNLKIQPEESRTYQSFATIAEAAMRGGKMVKSLLAFARENPAEEAELDLNALLRSHVEFLEHTTLAKVRLVLELAPDLQPIRGDGGALTSAFMNLSVNAVDAMPEAGTFTLRTRNLNADWVEVAVEDTGCGMTPEVLERALDPFFTTKEVGKGTGLGLAMVYSTVKAHHGHLEIQSEAGKGTRVVLRFPACQAKEKPLDLRVEPGPEACPRALRVLLVDDDELIQVSLEMLLGVLGHAVTIASCGEEALGALQAGLNPQVVILDMNMPGLGGAGTLPRLRALRPDLPVLLSTGRADQTALDLIEHYPRVTLLSKPFSMEQLKNHLEALRLGTAFTA